MSEYPKQMRWQDGETVEVFGPPSNGFVPIRWPTGDYDVEPSKNLSPLPSPDDIVEVVVKVTRKDRDTLAEGYWRIGSHWRVLVDACRAHRDAEA